VFRQAEIDIEVVIEVSNRDFPVGMPEARLQNQLWGAESTAKRKRVSNATEKQQQPVLLSGCGWNIAVSSQVNFLEAWVHAWTVVDVLIVLQCRE